MFIHFEHEDFQEPRSLEYLMKTSKEGDFASIIHFAEIKHPICFESPSNLEESLWNALHCDDKDEYLRLLKDPGFEQLRFSFNAQQVFGKDAVNIATALLNGETKGIIDVQDDLYYDGETPLHLAANTYTGSPRVTKYLLDRGDNVDVVCDYPRLNLKQATPIDVAVERIAINPQLTLRKSLFHVLWNLCHFMKGNLEVVRLLVQHSENKERVRQTFIDYAYKGKLVQLGVLFLAVPELFLSPNMAVPLEGGLSPFSMLYREVNSLEKKTDIQEGLSLLLEMWAIIGDKLVAYVRLGDTHEQSYETTKKEIDFLLRKVARKKPGVSFCDCYCRFFEPVMPAAVVQRSVVNLRGCWDNYPSGMESIDIYCSLPYYLMRRVDFDQAYILRLLPIMDRKNSGTLSRAIQKKLASMSTVEGGCFEPIERISNKGVKHPALGCTLLPCARRLVMPKSPFLTTTLSQFLVIAKRL